MKLMKTLKPLLLLLTVGVIGSFTTLPAWADDWAKTYTLTGRPDLSVQTSDANIQVSTWDQNVIEAKVTTMGYKIDANGIRIEEHQTGDVVEIEVRYPHPHIMFNWEVRNHRVDITIHMPREGRVKLGTGDGKINLAGFRGEMQLRSGDGSQDIDSVEGKLRAFTGDGSIRANGRFDELNLKTGDGRVEAHAASGSAIAENWRVETGDGTVTLELPDGLAADVDLHTGDGHIDLDMPVTTEGKIRQNEVRGKLNGGGKLLFIHTGDGSIRLRKG